MEFMRLQSFCREEGYSSALETASKKKGDIDCKVFALDAGCLDAGCLDLGRIRPDGLPTVYDDQAIQSDMQTRCYRTDQNNALPRRPETLAILAHVG